MEGVRLEEEEEGIDGSTACEEVHNSGSAVEEEDLTVRSKGPSHCIISLFRIQLQRAQCKMTSKNIIL